MKILWLKSDFLYPPNTGGRIRSFNILKQLTRNHQVHYLCLSDETPTPQALKYMQSLCRTVEYIGFNPPRKNTLRFYLSLLKSLFSGCPYVIGKYDNREIKSRIRQSLQAEKIDLIVCDFLEMAINCCAITAIPKVIFEHNVETEIWRRHYQVNRNPLKKAFLYLQYRKYLHYESAACAHFDEVLVVSETDGKLLENKYGVRHTTTIPTAVDIEYFRPGTDKVQSGNLVFVGSMDWLPNQDAVAYFVGEIYPKIKSRKPETRFHIVGRRPPGKIINLSKSDDSIVVSGTVDDIRPFVDRAEVCVIPLRIAGGTRIKIYEAMAQKKAIVSTTIGAEGLSLTDGQDIIIKDDPDQFAAAVCELMDNRKLAAAIGENAYKLVVNNYSWEKVAGRFCDVLEEVVNQRHGRMPVGEISGESSS